MALTHKINISDDVDAIGVVSGARACSCQLENCRQNDIRRDTPLKSIPSILVRALANVCERICGEWEQVCMYLEGLNMCQCICVTLIHEHSVVMLRSPNSSNQLL